MRSKSRMLFASAVALSAFTAPEVAKGDPPPSFSYVIPNAASIHGMNGTFFRTDLWLTNQSGSRLTLTLGFVCVIGACSPPQQVKSVSLNPSETKLIEDVVGSFLEAPESAGPISVNWWQWPYLGNGRLAVSTRTYSAEVGGGTYGTALTSIYSWKRFKSALFVPVAGSGGALDTGFRTNVGFFNDSYNPPRETTATLTLYGADGKVLGSSVTITFVRGTQVNDIFRAVGAGAVATREASLRVDFSEASFVYATVIDNRTGDSTYVDPDETDPNALKTMISGLITTKRQGASVAGVSVEVTQSGQTVMAYSDTSGLFVVYPLTYGYATMTVSPGGGCPDMTLTVYVPAGGLSLSPQVCP